MTLANVVGTDEPTVRRFLLEVGARGSAKDGAFWGLVSRNPLRSADGDYDPEPDRQRMLAATPDKI
jgi:hypothetical protein